MLQIDGTLIVIAVSFIIFTIIMQKIFYAPIAQVREERSNYILNNENLAKNTREEAANIEKDYENKITQARIKAGSIVSESTSAANKEKSALLEKTTKEVNNQINLAREDILNDKNNAKEALRSQIMSLAHSISAKVIGEEISISGTAQEIIDKELNR